MTEGQERLPCQYYLITFTLPRELRDLAWKHQKTVYSLMFSAVQDLLKSFTHNDKRIGGAPGFTAILHTHSRTLDYHPHIHVVMPAASIDLETGLWVAGLRVPGPGRAEAEKEEVDQACREMMESGFPGSPNSLFLTTRFVIVFFSTVRGS